ncbi:MAG: ShlB/FhaC/HecB family hemolysin secretion/activation protein [Pseudomonadota bacterium]
MIARLAFALIVLALCSTAAAAQPRGEGATPDQRLQRERILEEQRERLQDDQQPGLDLRQEPLAPPQAEAACFPIATIDISGVTLLAEEDISQISETFVRQCMGEQAIRTLLQALNAAYVERGFVTSRAYLPDQDLSSGVLRIIVVEGFIEGYELVTERETSDARRLRKLATAFPGEVGGPLQLREIEQGLDQIRRLASENPTADLMPGEEPGGTIVSITSTPEDQVRGLIGFDNDGSSATGENRLRFTLAADDILGVNEAFTFSLVGATGATSVVGALDVPYGWWTLSLEGSYSDSVSALTSAADLTSFSAGGSVGVERVLFRDASRILKVEVSARHRRSETFINDTALAPRDQTTFRLGGNYEKRGPGFVWIGDLGARFGAPVLGGDGNLDDDGSTTPQARFSAVDGSFSYVRAFPGGWQVFSQTEAQVSASGGLVSDEQVFIGGWSTVRGYDEFDFAADSGLYTRNELSFSAPAAWRTAFSGGLGSAGEALFDYVVDDLQPYAFVDAGLGRNVIAAESEFFSGLGAGLRFNNDRLSFDLAVAYPLLRTRSLREREAQLFLNVSLGVF